MLSHRVGCFLSDGRFEIDNWEVDQQIRQIALGKKNYLFAGSDTGAEMLSMAYTLFTSCHVHGVNPLEWATDVLCKPQDGWPRSHLDELLPYTWIKSTSPELAARNEAA